MHYKIQILLYVDTILKTFRVSQQVLDRDLEAEKKPLKITKNEKFVKVYLHCSFKLTNFLWQKMSKF